MEHRVSSVKKVTGQGRRKRLVLGAQNRFLEMGLIKNVPAKFSKSYLKTLRGESSQAGAIKSKCQECCGFEDVVDRVRNCTVKKCPLWCYRPYLNNAPSELKPVKD